MVKLQTDFCGLKECWSVVFQPTRQYFFNQFTVIDQKNILLILDNITFTKKKKLKKLALNNKSRKHQQGNLAVARQEI